MNYQEALFYIEEMNVYGSVLGLETMKNLLNKLDNPQDSLQFIHIAGTNGKGSVLAFVSTVLACQGYLVGRYISPTVVEYRERFQMNGKYISKKELGIFMERVKAACDEMKAEGGIHPTPFEIETALAFLYYKEKKCEIVVLETGLGGSLDATNVIQNTLVAVVTSISKDHMNFLGNTLEEIAESKAGIIKDDCYLIMAPQRKEVLEVLTSVAEQKKVSFQTADITGLSNVKATLKKQIFTYKQYKNMEIRLLGTYQLVNAITAIEVIEAMREKGYPISKEALKEGLVKAEWFGRCSILAEKPIFMIDGAHNEEAAQKLAETIAFHFTNKKIIYIMGVLKDKEYEKVVQATYPYAEHIITITPPNNPRAMHAYDLAQVVKEYHKSVTVADSLEEAVEMAYMLTEGNADGILVAFGSLSYLGALSEVVKNRKTLKFAL